MRCVKGSLLSLALISAVGAVATVARAEPPPPLEPQETFVVNLDRPWHKGDHQPFDLVVATSHELKTQTLGTGDDPVSQSEEIAAHLMGDCEISKVDDAGHELENIITVRQFTRTNDP